MTNKDKYLEEITNIVMSEFPPLRQKSLLKIAIDDIYQDGFKSGEKKTAEKIKNYVESESGKSGRKEIIQFTEKIINNKQK